MIEPVLTGAENASLPKAQNVKSVVAANNSRSLQLLGNPGRRRSGYHIDNCFSG